MLPSGSIRPVNLAATSPLSSFTMPLTNAPESCPRPCGFAAGEQIRDEEFRGTHRNSRRISGHAQKFAGTEGRRVRSWHPCPPDSWLTLAGWFKGAALQEGAMFARCRAICESSLARICPPAVFCGSSRPSSSGNFRACPKLRLRACAKLRTQRATHRVAPLLPAGSVQDRLSHGRFPVV